MFSNDHTNNDTTYSQEESGFSFIRTSDRSDKMINLIAMWQYLSTIQQTNKTSLIWPEIKQKRGKDVLDAMSQFDHNSFLYRI